MDFTSSTGGFTANSATSVGLSGGTLEIAGAAGGGDFFETPTRAADLTFDSSSPLGIELANAKTNGGTITFDVSINEADIVWEGAGRPSNLEVQLTLASPDFDTEVVLLSVPGVGGTSSNTFSTDIVAGNGQQFNGTNGSINFNENPGTLSIGLKDSGDFITSATFTIDNFTVAANASAVPEPSSMALLAFGGAGLVWRRRKSKRTSA
ncbi:MAG: PEP-CTERM sorting domain-containing protein [Rhodopirellula sp. JB055]|uniref:PEP-CTERM sorting domain-containing protein n=1 Tax=Rhodopirellula sp. JB055 TaxID=3342846 RepID=UPI00370B8DE5